MRGTSKLNIYIIKRVRGGTDVDEKRNIIFMHALIIFMQQLDVGELKGAQYSFIIRFPSQLDRQFSAGCVHRRDRVLFEENPEEKGRRGGVSRRPASESHRW